MLISIKYILFLIIIISRRGICQKKMKPYASHVDIDGKANGTPTMFLKEPNAPIAGDTPLSY